MDFIRGTRQLIRRFGRAPLFTAICASTLALGIGAATAMYAVVDAVLLEPLPYPAHDRLVDISYSAPGLDVTDVSQSPALHYATKSASRTIEALGMYTTSRSTVTQLGDPEEVGNLWLTEGTLRLLGAKTARGRLFGAADDEAGAAPTVVVSHGYWQRRLDADPNVVGRILTINGTSREVIGVLADDFRMVDADAELYMPFQFEPGNIIMGNFSYRGIARLRDGVSIEQASADLARIVPIAAERFPGPISLSMLEQARFEPTLRPLAADVIGDAGNFLWVLLGTVGIVLLIACANVANLFLVRAEGRYREVAVRTAMGASRARIAREFMTESLGMALVGGAVGVGLALAAIRLLHVLQPEHLPRLDSIAIDGSVLLMALLLTLATGALLGLVPILRHGGDRVSGILREGGRGGSAGRERHRARSVLVVGQLALALVLLAGSGLMMRTALAMRSVDPGFTEPESLLTMRLAIASADVEEPEAVAAMHERIVRNLENVPGIARVGLASGVPMSGWESNDPLEIEQFPVQPGQIAPIRRYKWISPEYFETLGTPVVAGRAYTWDDLRNRPPVVIISESLAREYWDTPAEAIGKRVRNMDGRPWREIIGVVGDVREDGMDQAATPIAYWPMIMESLWEDGLQVQRTLSYALRLNGTPSPALMDAIRRAVWEVNPNLPLADIRTMDDVVDESMARTSFTLVMLAIASVVALLLGAIGLYGVISYAVAQRTREFCVRMALGARATDVGSLVLKHAIVLVGVGVAAGLAGAFALTRLMAAMLYGVAPSDPVTFVGVAALLAAVALVASLVPVARAARVDPLDALRTE
ncbi:MAG: ABC transporter permease [Longimicrobiales bacterium]